MKKLENLLYFSSEQLHNSQENNKRITLENSMLRSALESEREAAKAKEAELDKTTSESQTAGSITNELTAAGLKINELNSPGTQNDDVDTTRPSGWPVASRKITSVFGSRVNPFNKSSTERHSGIDIAAPYGSKVCATADGIVAFSGWNSSGYGYLVIIEHSGGYSSYYAHNSTLLVKTGSHVKRGEVIALSGNSGRSTGPHCHYEIRQNDVPQNPKKYM